MTTQTPPNNGEEQDHPDHARDTDDQVTQITDVVLRSIEARWGVERKDVEEITGSLRVLQKVTWLFTYWTPILFILSGLIIVLGLLLYRVSPLQIVEGSVARYQEAEQEEDIVSRHLRLGDDFLGIGQPVAARTEFEKALELDPTNTDAELGIIKCDLFIPILEQNYSLEVTQQRLQLLKDEVPNDPHIYTFLGNIFQKSHPLKALEHYDRAIDQDPLNAHAYYSKGTVYEGQGKLDEALEMYEEAQSHAEWNPLYQQAVAYVLYKQNHYDKARAKYENLVHWEPQYLWAYSDLALVYQLLGQVRIADFYQKQLVTLLKDETVISMGKNQGTLAYSSRMGPVYLSQPAEKLYYVYYNAAWTAHLLGDQEETRQYIGMAAAQELDADRKWEIRQVLDDNIALLLSENPKLAPEADQFRGDFIGDEALSIEEGSSLGGRASAPSEEPLDGKQQAVSAAVRGHYAAIEEQDLEEAFSYFGADYRQLVDETYWIATQNIYQVRSTAINSLGVDEVRGDTATVTADVSFEDNTGDPRFLVTWHLVRENEEWKLNKAFSIQRLT